MALGLAIGARQVRSQTKAKFWLLLRTVRSTTGQISICEKQKRRDLVGQPAGWATVSR
jgi:hypothetical protein